MHEVYNAKVAEIDERDQKHGELDVNDCRIGERTTHDESEEKSAKCVLNLLLRIRTLPLLMLTSTNVQKEKMLQKRMSVCSLRSLKSAECPSSSGTNIPTGQPLG